MNSKRAILVLNAGSSSLKFASFETGAAREATMRGKIEKLDSSPRFEARGGDGAPLEAMPLPSGANFDEIVERLLTFVEARLGQDELIAVGHRVVHGGAEHIQPERVTPESLAALNALAPLDPLHLPHNLAPMRAIAAARPQLVQVACFDTAFHRTMPREASLLALPRAMIDAGMRRWGFHGLSYEFIVERLKIDAPALASGKVIVAHLGAGASLCALQSGVSIDTTMGFSVLDGLVMATRSGSLDPGAILYLMRQGKSADDLEDLLYRKSGLLGVSGIAGDVRVLLESSEPSAREALDLFTYRAAKEIGGLTSALGGLDGLVFTAGIGENSASIRAEICARLAWLGVRLDRQANSSHADCISAEDSRVKVLVVATDEEATIARHAEALVVGAG